MKINNQPTIQRTKQPTNQPTINNHSYISYTPEITNRGRDTVEPTAMEMIMIR